MEEVARQIRAVGCDHVILTTDFGQPDAPFSDEGLKEYAAQLQKFGFSSDELKTMMCKNPAAVLSSRE